MNKSTIDKDKEVVYKELSYKVINAALYVHNKLGVGFLEKVYENALIIAFKKNNIQCKQQIPLIVYFEGEIVGEYFADIIVEDKIIIELKTVDKILDIHRAQVMNYLRATRYKLALLINFARPKLEWERIVM